MRAANPLLGWVDVAEDERGGSPFVVAGLYAEHPVEDIELFDANGKTKAGLLEARKEIASWTGNVACNLQVEKTADGYEARLMRSNGPGFDVMISATEGKPEQAMTTLWALVLDCVACFEQWHGFLAWSKANKGKINPFQLG